MLWNRCTVISLSILSKIYFSMYMIKLAFIIHVWKYSLDSSGSNRISNASVISKDTNGYSGSFVVSNIVFQDHLLLWAQQTYRIRTHIKDISVKLIIKLQAICIRNIFGIKFGKRNLRFLIINVFWIHLRKVSPPPWSLLFGLNKYQQIQNAASFSLLYSNQLAYWRYQALLKRLCLSPNFVEGKLFRFGWHGPFNIYAFDIHLEYLDDIRNSNSFTRICL